MPATKTIEMTAEELTEAVAIKVMKWDRKEDDLSLTGWIWSNGYGVMVDPDWGPCDSPDDLEMLITRMRCCGWRVIIKDFAFGWCVTYHRLNDSEDSRHYKLGVAIMLAAYEAITGKHVELKEEEAGK